MSNRIGELFGSYELIQLLGRGGFAEVYLGRHTRIPQQLAAIKILEKQLIIPKSQQFQREASIVATLRHPNIVQMYDYNVYSNPELTRTLVPYIIMQYAPNKSLRAKHPRGMPLPIKTVLTYTAQIAAALQYAHDKNVMHLDVKPENILIDEQGKLLLSDFGLATLLTEQEKTGDVQGTLSYMSPEQLDAKPGFASDQYALGVMVYEWMAGRLPFTGSSVKEVIDKHLKAPPPSLCAQITTLPPETEEVIFKALAKNPADRYPNIKSFAEALDRSLSGVKGKSSASPQPAPPANPGVQQGEVLFAAHQQPAPQKNTPGGMGEPLFSPRLQPNSAANSFIPFSQPGPAAPLPNPPRAAQIPDPVNPTPPILPFSAPPLAGGANQGAPSMPPPPPGMPFPQPGGSGANSPLSPVEPLFSPPSNTPPGGFSPLSRASGPFQPGPPPGSQAAFQQQFAPGGGGSPFLTSPPVSPTNTTIFDFAGAPPYPSPPPGPGPLPPYPMGNSFTGSYSTSQSRSKGLAETTRSFLKPPSPAVRRQRIPLLVAGLGANLISLFCIGPWLLQITTSYHNLTAAWLIILALISTVTATLLFFNSGNKSLNIVISFLLAAYWGVVGNAFGDLTHGTFLFDPGILSFVFFLGALGLHLSFATRRR